MPNHYPRLCAIALALVALVCGLAIAEALAR